MEDISLLAANKETMNIVIIILTYACYSEMDKIHCAALLTSIINLKFHIYFMEGS